MKVSKWDEVLQKLTESVKYKLPEIGQNDLVKFCLENETTRSTVEYFLKNFQKSNTKDSTRALQKKEEGNENYKQKKFEESLSLYTDSIFNASKHDKCLPLTYSNRSLVLHQIGYLSESLIDIDMALASGYPKEKTDKLLLRKAKCYVKLGNNEKAKEILTEVLRKSKKKEFFEVIENELKKLENLESNKILISKSRLPEHVGGENKDFVSASNYLSLYYDETRGRHVIANQDIKVGDVLFVEKPFAFVIFSKACFNCCKNTIAPIPCWNCLDVFYCSPECRDSFWKSVHSFECGFAELFKSIGIAHLSLRIILEASCNLNELKKTLSNISELKYENGIVLYRSKGYDCVYNLVHNSNKYETNDLFQYAMTALLLALYLKNHTSYFSEEADDKDLELLSSVIWRHILQLICNGHAVSNILLKGSEGKLVLNKREVRIGTAIYTSASMMNHSCEPSVINCFHQNYLIVRAAKDINKGEEVFNCYGPRAKTMKRANRQEILRNQYFFNCKCQPCLQKLDIQDKFTAFKCINCKGPAIPREENSKNTVCLNCGKTSEIPLELARKHNKFYSLIEEGELLLNSDVTLSFKKFLESWWLGREIFYKFHKDLSYAADEVARCLLDLQDFKRCILFLKCCVRSVEERFGFLSFELAEEIKKLADVITCYLVNDKKNAKRDLARQGVLYYQKAERIINLLYGFDNIVLEEIITNKGILEDLLKNI